MAIPESQLETWSHLGSVQGSSTTYQTIRAALLSAKALYAPKSFEVFLQGSYENDTNIYADSDVDVVIRLDSFFNGDISRLPVDEQDAYQRAYSNSTGYTFHEFKQQVVTRLSTAFGEDQVKVENKAIKIASNGARRDADVVPCYQHRRYTRFVSPNNANYISGIIFPSSSTGNVINFPKSHSDNCTNKHQATSSWFKPMVRIVKNMRNKLVVDRIIERKLAPSYYIEGLLYNVPSNLFGQNYVRTFCNCINWLKQSDQPRLICANEQYFLLGQSNVQWPSNNCEEFLNALCNLWTNW